MTGLLFSGLAIVVLIAGLAARRRVREAKTGGLTDELMRQIEIEGRLDVEDVEDLDVGEARAEEDEFWSQTWDEPDQTF